MPSGRRAFVLVFAEYVRIRSDRIRPLVDPCRIFRTPSVPATPDPAKVESDDICEVEVVEEAVEVLVLAFDHVKRAVPGGVSDRHRVVIVPYSDDDVFATPFPHMLTHEITGNNC